MSEKTEVKENCQERWKKEKRRKERAGRRMTGWNKVWKANKEGQNWEKENRPQL